jgi:hypothetical protein
MANPSVSRNPNLRESPPSQFRLVEGAVLCACPECQSLMSVRLWLGVADCWNCGSSVELSEEQEREVERLLAARPPVSAAAPTVAAKPATVAAKPATTLPRVAVASPHTAVPAPARSRRPPGAVSRAALRRRLRRHWLREWLRDMPAWLVSLVLHTALLLLLGILNVYESIEVPFITLSTSVSREKVEG